MVSRPGRGRTGRPPRTFSFHPVRKKDPAAAAAKCENPRILRIRITVEAANPIGRFLGTWRAKSFMESFFYAIWQVLGYSRTRRLFYQMRGLRRLSYAIWQVVDVWGTRKLCYLESLRMPGGRRLFNVLEARSQHAYPDI